MHFSPGLVCETGGKSSNTTERDNYSHVISCGWEKSYTRKEEPRGWVCYFSFLQVISGFIYQLGVRPLFGWLTNWKNNQRDTGATNNCDINMNFGFLFTIAVLVLRLGEQRLNLSMIYVGYTLKEKFQKGFSTVMPFWVHQRIYFFKRTILFFLSVKNILVKDFSPF